jgi:phosphatidylserine/phosphatidylglycerophosphate/cardiolipin synthase-like enzyme
MADFVNAESKSGMTMKLWRGERMCALGFNVVHPEPDFVGFAIECKAPGEADYRPLLNRIAFSYDPPAGEVVTGDRKFDSREAPFQKFRWIHFPFEPKEGKYRYRATKMHMKEDESLSKGTEIELDIALNQVTYDGLVDIGFTRNFASSPAYREQFGNNENIIPAETKNGLKFKKIDLKNDRGVSVYDWLGFEAYHHIFDFLRSTLDDARLTLDVLAYDLNEPDIVDLLEKFGTRLRIIIDDSSSKEKGVEVGHVLPTSPESIAAKRLRKTAGTLNVHRTHFQNLQHNKVFVARQNGEPTRALCGSTNFTFRGIYIQANNVLVFHDPDVAKVFGKMFELAFSAPESFKTEEFAKTWHVIPNEGRPTIHLCFSPHTQTDLSLNPIRAAVDQATSSVLYSIAFLNQMKSGPTFEAFGRLMKRQIFSYGTVDTAGKNLELFKPDGTHGLVDFNYLASKAPEPFRSEWSGGKGRNVHHKFVVTDFNLSTAKVFTGSSNFSPSGEAKNGDQLVMIEDQKIAVAYAIEAVRVFDHLEFRKIMQDAAKGNEKAKKPLERIALRKPTSISGKPAWFEKSYVPGSQREKDRKVFST